MIIKIIMKVHQKNKEANIHNYNKVCKVKFLIIKNIMKVNQKNKKAKIYN